MNQQKLIEYINNSIITYYEDISLDEVTTINFIFTDSDIDPSRDSTQEYQLADKDRIQINHSEGVENIHLESFSKSIYKPIIEFICSTWPDKPLPNPEEIRLIKVQFSEILPKSLAESSKNSISIEFESPTIVSGLEKHLCSVFTRWKFPSENTELEDLYIYKSILGQFQVEIEGKTDIPLYSYPDINTIKDYYSIILYNSEYDPERTLHPIDDTFQVTLNTTLSFTIQKYLSFVHTKLKNKYLDSLPITFEFLELHLTQQKQTISYSFNYTF